MSILPDILSDMTHYRVCSNKLSTAPKSDDMLSLTLICNEGRLVLYGLCEDLQ